MLNCLNVGCNSIIQLDDRYDASLLFRINRDTVQNHIQVLRTTPVRHQRGKREEGRGPVSCLILSLPSRASYTPIIKLIFSHQLRHLKPPRTHPIVKKPKYTTTTMTETDPEIATKAPESDVQEDIPITADAPPAAAQEPEPTQPKMGENCHTDRPTRPSAPASSPG